MVDCFIVQPNKNVADILTNALMKDQYKKFPWRWGYGNRGSLNVRFKVVSLCFWAHRFPCLSIDGHPQAMVVLFPCALSQGLNEATMGISLYVSSLLICFLAPRCTAREEYCIIGLCLLWPEI
jgi:hypothetical protein